MTKRVFFFAFAALVIGVFGVVNADPVPTTLEDFFLPGSQPNESGQLQTPDKCDNCHGDYDVNAEPVFNWRGSMMGQAARDPLFYACMAIAEQDAPGSGDLCIRCHSPAGWLEGRSVPTDGSALNANDREGVQCDFCHKMVKPTPLGVNPYPGDSIYTADTYPQDQLYLATIDSIPGHSANGMYVADEDNGKRGPYSDADANHQFWYSPFHPDANLCGTCHDVSNPVYTVDANGKYQPNTFDERAPDFSPQSMFPIERTFSEWLMSDYNSASGVYAPQFGGNKDYVASCQDCHMRDVTGQGCNKNPPVRDDLPLHDFTGGNTTIPPMIAQQYPGEIDPVALDSGIARATYMLQNAATMDLSASVESSSYELYVRVTNETGHKLPSGYPEGRRIWINVKAYDTSNNLIYESGAYDSATAVLTQDADVKVYEIHPGISQTLSSVVNFPPGESFHFVLNDSIYFDNRIPPRGFTNANFETIQSPPVGYSYADGEYWDDTEYDIPDSAERAEVTLYYQTTSKEYVEFLRDENTTNTAGQDFYDLWAAFGKSAPVAMETDTLYFGEPTDTDGDGIVDAEDNCPNDFNPDQIDDDSDGYGAACDCNDADSTINPETVWYADADGDTYGDPTTTLTQCEMPSGYVLDSTDCNDADSTINPETVWYYDLDEDGWGDPDSTVVQCEGADGFVRQHPDNCVGVFNPDQADSNGDGIGDACDTDCLCAFQGDLDGNGALDAIDLNLMIEVLFFNGSDVCDPTCPNCRSDVTCDDVSDSTDLNYLITAIFFNGAPPCDPCAP
ncbi:MAG: hypothetical protein GF341_03990 [candidate division Zixibacteria bacterium]|nr:hypothetical protein [candidate division Zixibacteria bacterium]